MSLYLGSNKITPIIMDNQPGFMPNSKLIAEKTYSFTLADTNFSSLTISTSQQALTLPATEYSSATTGYSTVYRIGEDYDGIINDRSSHDYMTFGKYIINFAYTVDESMINNTYGIKVCGAYTNATSYRYKKTDTSGAQSTIYSTASSQTASYGTNQLLYKKTDGTYGTVSGYGLYSSSTPYSTTGLTNDKSYIVLAFGYLYVRAHATYFPVDSMNYIDPSKTTITINWKVYEGDQNIFGYNYQTVYDELALS